MEKLAILREAIVQLRYGISCPRFEQRQIWLSLRLLRCSIYCPPSQEIRTRVLFRRQGAGWLRHLGWPFKDWSWGYQIKITAKKKAIQYATMEDFLHNKAHLTLDERAYILNNISKAPIWLVKGLVWPKKGLGLGKKYIKFKISRPAQTFDEQSAESKVTQAKIVQNLKLNKRVIFIEECWVTWRIISTTAFFLLKKPITM